MKIAFIIIVLAILTAAAPPSSSLTLRNFARQLAHEVSTMQLVVRTQAYQHNRSLALDPVVLSQIAAYQRNLYELKISGMLDKFNQLQVLLRKFNARREDQDEKIAMQQLLDNLHLTPSYMNELSAVAFIQNHFSGSIGLPPFDESYLDIPYFDSYQMIADREEFLNSCYEACVFLILRSLLRMAKLQEASDAINNLTQLINSNDTLKAKQLVAKFAAIVKEHSWMYTGRIDRQRANKTMEKAQKIVAATPQSPAEQTAQLNKLQDMLQPMIADMVERTGKVWGKNGIMFAEITRNNPDMMFTFEEYLQSHYTIANNELSQQTLDIYNKTSSVLDNYLNTIEQQPSQESIARKTAITELDLDQDMFAALVAAHRLQHRYNELVGPIFSQNSDKLRKADPKEFIKELQQVYAQHNDNINHYKANMEKQLSKKDSSKAKLTLARGADMQKMFDPENFAYYKLIEKMRMSFFGNAASFRDDESYPYQSEVHKASAKYKMSQVRESIKILSENIAPELWLHENVGIKRQAVIRPLREDEVLHVTESLADFYQADVANFFEDYNIAKFSIFSITFADFSYLYTQNQHSLATILHIHPPPNLPRTEFEPVTEIISMN